MLSFNFQNLGDVTIYKCAGRLTAGSADNLQRAVLLRPYAGAIVLDLAAVSAVDAAGLGTLLYLRQRTRAAGVKLKLMNLTPKMEELLRLTKLTAAFEVCSLREMLDFMCRDAQQPRFSAALAQQAA